MVLVKFVLGVIYSAIGLAATAGGVGHPLLDFGRCSWSYLFSFGRRVFLVSDIMGELSGFYCESVFLRFLLCGTAAHRVCLKMLGFAFSFLLLRLFLIL